MNKYFFNALLMLFFIFSSGLTAAAQEQVKDNQDDAVRMDEVVVVASPIIAGTQVNDYGSEVTIVRKKQIADLNAQDLQQALRLTPGVAISRHNPVGSFGGGDGGAVYIRGMGSSRPGGEVLTLIDGVPKYAGIWTHPLMDIMNVDIADRIEIYKGAQPILFGNMAFAAVNVITKQQKEEGFSTRIQSAFGSYNSFMETLEHGGKIKDTDYYVVQSFKHSDGHRENAAGELQNYFARIGQRLSETWSIALTANLTHNAVDDPGPLGRPRERQGVYRAEENMIVATLAHKYDHLKGDFKAYWNNGKDSWLSQFDLTGLFNFDTITSYDNYGFRAKEIFTLWTGGAVTAGADLDFTAGKVLIDRVLPRTDSNFPSDTFRIVSPYLALSQEIELAGNWLLIPSAGIRYYSHSDFSAKLTPQSGVALRNQSTELHAFYSRGINYPGIYAEAQSNLFWGNNTLWKNLDPETVDHLEIGVSHSFSPRVRSSINYFHDQGNNRLILVTNPAPPHYENIASFETQGIEAALTLHPVKNLSFFIGGTYIPERSPDNLPYTPQWSASAGVNVRFLEMFRISLDTLYQDAQYVANNRNLNFGGSSIARIDGFFILNGKISYDFNLTAAKLAGELFLAGENLTNVSYAYKKDYPMPGINCMLGISLKL